MCCRFACICWACAAPATYAQETPEPYYTQERLAPHFTYLAETYVTREDTLRVLDTYLDRFRSKIEMVFPFPSGGSLQSAGEVKIVITDMRPRLTADSLLTLTLSSNQDSITISVYDVLDISEERLIPVDLREIQAFLHAEIFSLMPLDDVSPEQLRAAIEYIMNSYDIEITPGNEVSIAPPLKPSSGNQSSEFSSSIFVSGKPVPLVLGKSGAEGHLWVVHSSPILHNAGKYLRVDFHGQSIIIVDIYRQFVDPELGYYEVRVESERRWAAGDWEPYNTSLAIAIEKEFHLRLREKLNTGQ